MSFLTGLGCASLFWTASLADDVSYSFNNFGGVGLLDMRTARFSPDGTIAIGVHHDNHGTRYLSTWQATPWLETTLSYTDNELTQLGVDRSLDVKIRLMTEGNYRPQLAIGIQDALGRGRFSAEYLVASKRYYDFDFTMGFAWGYLGSRGGVGNMFKLFGDSFRERSTSTTSGGIRTGSYFSGQNMSFFAGVEYQTPIRGLNLKVEYSGVDTTKITDFIQVKRNSAFNVGLNYKPTSWADIAVGYDYGDRVSIRLILKHNLRKLKFKRWFKGQEPAPILERHRTITPHEVTAETQHITIDNDDAFDRLHRLGAEVLEIGQSEGRTVFKIQIHGDKYSNHLVFLGAILESYDKVTLYIQEQGPQGLGEAAQKYDATKGDTIGKAALAKFRGTAVYLREKLSEGQGRIAQSNDEVSLMARTTYEALEKKKLSPIMVSIDKQRAVVRKETGPNFGLVKNIGRTVRVMSREMPDEVEEFTVVSEKDGIEISRVSLLRRDLEKSNSYQSSPEEIWANSKILTPNSPVDRPSTEGNSYSGQSMLTYDWGFEPALLTHFGGNDDGRFRADLYAKLYGSVRFGRDVKLSGAVKQYIGGDIDQVPMDNMTTIPKVRSDISRYSKEGRTALERLQFDYTAQFSQNIYARLTGGLLESMYGGFGAELLYRPYDHNFAISMDVNWVKQREFDQLFSFRDYDVFTGHVTFYYENTTYNITSKLSAGRYLAGDYGATYDISRRFSNGVRIGVWATVTNMSSDEFGEGSFDKGIYLTMPLEIFWYKPTQKKTRFNFRSLGKNGGQMLNKNGNLYDLLSSGQKHRLAGEWQEILN
ncbi:MAG: YjbH domain-containing protein [Emcibacter sp.]|nr:YjbH domain-containing protein [Emcibacter sp.]